MIQINSPDIQGRGEMGDQYWECKKGRIAYQVEKNNCAVDRDTELRVVQSIVLLEHVGGCRLAGAKVGYQD